MKSVEYQELLMRPIQLGDAAALDAAIKETKDSLRRYIKWAHFKSSVTLQQNRIQCDPNEHEFGIFHKQSGDLLVCCGYNRNKTINGNGVELYCWTRKKFQKHGLASKACRLLTITAFEYYCFDRVDAAASPTNKASIRILQGCGFHFEGRLRNVLPLPADEMISNGYEQNRHLLVYSLLPEERDTLDWYKNMQPHVRVNS